MLNFFKRHCIEIVIALIFILCVVSVFTTPWETTNNKPDVVRAQAECKDFGGVFHMITRQAPYGSDKSVRNVSVLCRDHLTVKWTYKE